MRPRVSLLSQDLISRVLIEATDLLDAVGIEIGDARSLEMLESAGARVDHSSCRAFIGAELIESALDTSPSRFQLYDLDGELTHDLGSGCTYFVPASAATRFLDHGSARAPRTADYTVYARLVSRLPELTAQSTAMIPEDVPEQISDSWRLYLSLLHCKKPVVTGAFSLDGLRVIHELLLAARGSRAALEEKPLGILTCCPTSPLSWSEVGAASLVRCAELGVPVEIVSMPLAGFTSPVTTVGTLIQHTAETLSGVVIHQLAAPGAPLLWGCAAAVFDVRYETTPMGAIETMMAGCGASQIGQTLGLPTQAYIALSDAKLLDAQAGIETSMGATLAMLSGIDNVSGPGMLDLINCLSLEKLVVDHEICRMVRRLSRGAQPRDDIPARPLIDELLKERHLLIADHTLRHISEEIELPGPVIDRASRDRWQSEGSRALETRARSEVERLTGEAAAAPSGALASDSLRADLESIIRSAGRAAGTETLPEPGHR